MTFVRTDILNPYQREILSTDTYQSLLEFLLDKFPNGFENPVDISINANIISVEDYDTLLNENDVIVLLDRTALPAAYIAGSWFLTALANLAISVTLSYIANKLFAPDADSEKPQPSSVYNVASGQNIARYGSPVPIVYGKVRMYPSMIVQPYYRYEDNNQYLYHVLCVSQGTCTTDEVLIGEDEITSLDDLDWKLLYQDDFYNIPDNGYGSHVTSTLSNPSNMEIEVETTNEETGELEFGETEKYTIRKDAEFVEFDYVYPNGLIYYESDGETTAIRTEFKFTIYTRSGGIYTEQYSESFYKNVSNVTPLRFTHRHDISMYDEDVYISFEKTMNAASSWYVTNTVIQRIKEIYPNEDFTNLYGDITLLACRIKATNAVSSAGQVKVNGYFERTDVGNTMAEVLTDLYTNTQYGGALSESDLIFPTTEEVVDCVYEENLTVFDAMRKPALAQGFSLYLAGMDVILKKDGVNNITSGMYNEMNILQNSLKAQYLFKEEYPAYDGYECTYIKGVGWTPQATRYPLSCTRPKVVDLFGVVDWETPLSYNKIEIQFVTNSVAATSNQNPPYPWLVSGGMMLDMFLDGTWYYTNPTHDISLPGRVYLSIFQSTEFDADVTGVGMANIVEDNLAPTLAAHMTFEREGIGTSPIVTITSSQMMYGEALFAYVWSTEGQTYPAGEYYPETDQISPIITYSTV